MVKYRVGDVGSTFGALADATRRGLLERLCRGEASVSELAAPTGISMPAVVKHLRALEAAELVVGEKRGRVRWYRIRPERLREAAAWLARYEAFWEAQLDSLERFMEENNNDE